YIRAGITNCNFDGNTIYNVVFTSTGGYGGKGYEISTGLTSANIQIANNVIYGILGDGWSQSSTDAIVGIRVSGTNGGIKIYNNTISLTGNANEPSSGWASACVYFSSGSSSIDFRNNILMNSIVNQVASQTAYAVYSDAAASAFSYINNNDYYGYGSQGVLGYFGGTDRTSLSAWRTATGSDANSCNLNVNFKSATDYHINGSSLGENNLLGASISTVTTDFEGETRRTTRPNMGVDEVRPMFTINPDINNYAGISCSGGNFTYTFGYSYVWGDGIARTLGAYSPVRSWYKDGGVLAGQTGVTLNLNPATMADAGIYFAMVTFGGESAQTASTTLTVEDPMVLNTAPVSNTFCATAGDQTLTAIANGTILTQQWQIESPVGSGNFVDIPGATGSDYTPAVASLSAISSTASPLVYNADNFRFQIIGPGNCGPAVINSNPVTLEAYTPISSNTISCIPTTKQPCISLSFQLSCDAQGSIFAYQWQKYEGGTWRNLQPVEVVNNSNTAQTLIINNVVMTHTGDYRCRVTGSAVCGNSVENTLPIHITVISGNSFYQQPQSIQACRGANVQFSVIVIGDVFQYRWQKDGIDIAGNPSASTPTLFINNSDNKHTGIYSCIVTMNDCAGVYDTTSAEAVLYLHRKTTITSKPDTISTQVNGESMFQVFAHTIGAPPDYREKVQWYKGTTELTDNDFIEGAQSSILTIKHIKPDDLGSDYWVIVSGLCSADTLRGFTLMISGVDITSQPGDVTACEGTSASFTMTANPTGGGTSVSYQWKFNNADVMDGGNISGATTSVLMFNPVTPANAGSYTCVATVVPGTANQTSMPAVLTVNTKPAFTVDLPTAISIKSGDPIELIVAATGTSPLAYQWYLNNNAITTATSATLSVASATTNDGGAYFCRVTNTCGSSDSKTANITITLIDVTSVGDVDNDGIGLYANTPNPFGEITTIKFRIPVAAQAKLALLDVLGREILTIADGNFEKGLNEVTFDATKMNLTSGVYYYCLVTNGTTKTKKMVVVR
ncbi:MAG: C-terminal target protein, partial [Ignavibacteria bacterium]|nr:C-terminal target protein [Ignavibacteria bacterium]